LRPKGFGDTSSPIETQAEQQGDEPIVTAESFSATRWPATPSKVSVAFSPGELVVTVTAGPPGWIAYVCTATPETVCVSLPTVTVRVCAPGELGVNEPLKTPSARASSWNGTPFTLTAGTDVPPHGVASTWTGTGSPTSTWNPGAGASTHDRGAPAHRTAEFTLSRPPVLTAPSSPATRSADRSSSAFSSTSVASGSAAFANAAAPATCGEAIDVPESYR
jgi:hypothetical protein